MNLHDWIDEMCDLLDVETEADEALLGDLAEVAAENVHPGAGPVTTFLLGVAAGTRDAGPEAVERLAAAVQELAESWDRPAGEDDGVEDVEVDESVDFADELEDEEEDEDALV